MLLGCAPTVPTSRAPAGGETAAATESRAPKMLTIGQPDSKKGFAPWFIMGSGRALQWEDSRLQPLPQNRYVGSNGGHYVNPTLDGLLDKLYATVPEREQGVILKELGDIVAADLPMLPMYFGVNTVAALKHVRALDDFAGAVRVGTTARNAHLWDRE